MVQDDDSPMGWRQRGECVIEKLPLGDLLDLIGIVLIDPQLADIRSEPLDAPSLGVTTADKDLVQPCVEAVGISQGRQCPPRNDDALLDGVLGNVGIAEDLTSRSEQAVPGGANEGLKRVFVARRRAPDEVARSLQTTVARASPARSLAIQASEVAACNIITACAVGNGLPRSDRPHAPNASQAAAMPASKSMNGP